MPRRLVCLFGTGFYLDHALLLEAEYLVSDKTKQLVKVVKAEAPLEDQPKPAKSNGFKGMWQRKSTIAQKELPPPPYTKAVSDAYGFINEHYQPGDEIILFAITGTQYDWPVLRAAVQVLAEHLGAGTEPPRVAPDQDPEQVSDAERDVFNDRPPKEAPKNILAKKIESSVAILYKSLSSLTEINNALLEEFPLSAKHIFSFNWAAGRENYCNSFRDDTGLLTSREVGYFKNIQWHIPVVVHATMNFIHYKSKHTLVWRTIKPTIPCTLTSLPAPLMPECPPSPTITPPISTRKQKFSWRFGSKNNSRSPTASSARTTQRSSTLMSGYTIRRSDTLMSGFTTKTSTPLVSSPPPMPPTSDFPFARTSSPTSSLDLTQSSRTSITSIDSTHPTLREAYGSLPGMTKHQVWTYPAFGTMKDNHALPERVIWRSSRE